MVVVFVHGVSRWDDGEFKKTRRSFFNKLIDKHPPFALSCPSGFGVLWKPRVIRKQFHVDREGLFKIVMMSEWSLLVISFFVSGAARCH